MPDETEALTMTAEITPIRLPVKEGAFVQEIRSKFGDRVAAEVQCVLTRQIKGFYSLRAGELEFVRSLAKARKINLPA